MISLGALSLVEFVKYSAAAEPTGATAENVEVNVK